MSKYDDELAAMPNTIAERIAELAVELHERITDPEYRSDFHELLGGEVHHIMFGGVDGDEGGRAYPTNAAEWVTLRAMPHFEQLLKDHCEDRLTVGMYENPIHGMSAAVSATIADIVAYRVIDINKGFDAEVTPKDRG